MFNQQKLKNTLKNVAKKVENPAAMKKTLAKEAKKAQKDLKKIEKKVAAKKDLETLQKAKVQASLSLDDLIKEYGMEGESEAILTGDWAAPYGNFYANAYHGFDEPHVADAWGSEFFF